jgi:hypothetical protein
VLDGLNGPLIGCYAEYYSRLTVNTRLEVIDYPEREADARGW